MNICVTGGAGYIGSHAVKMLLAQNHHVIVVDNLSTGFQYAIPSEVPFYQIATHDESALVEVFKKEQVEAVMHFAAFSLVGESVEKPLKYYQNNVEGTRALLEAMATAHVHKLIFSSTAAVYGTKEVQPITETMEETPENPYGETKLAIEKMLKWFSKTTPLNYITLRYFNVAGAYYDGSIGENHNPETHLIPNVIKSVLHKGAPLKVFGNDYPTPDGTPIRDYIHVEDLVDAHIKALDYLTKHKKNEIINLGSSSGYSVLEVILATERITGIKVPYTIEPRRAGDPAKLIASNQLAYDLLAWQPTKTLETMIESAYKYFKNKA
ncbi:UDP-glucose 4-epimerase GalE [Liberiplasma polymorphum]|uniref:UDP-glucose 4-epimerase GalE n=1 Tax=Liberiplasma polymorphum TaxID=3374570 RepID=UPI003774759C